MARKKLGEPIVATRTVDKNDPDFRQARKEANRKASRVSRAFIRGIPQKTRKGITTGEKKLLRRLIAVEILQAHGWNATIAEVP